MANAEAAGVHMKKGVEKAQAMEKFFDLHNLKFPKNLADKVSPANQKKILAAVSKNFDQLKALH